ncbi:bifunctional [glutamate--ammonia ligase]-adenylyl-L-tyrosine phosphorylase/[glutamate--ammonia-ligase] adenylyltransferase [Candidatus Methylospira mobilis]|uniref:Bifunctional glutamine synthetase adenylyltransferase/adenylyl-removing enzyme n=1 Tax=Candidatus Methylospira mobilis TaxID=1808979 RepID=A0A5Q0BIC6_9GAMM|nr:bifunctional [glutamate--ammonia ligase]-adenylyl-L-tyrosine phosphorylase/[glutamate--ammonia-ligase] adenylyltransferase [Candidatus Methylospira mobilis]QFY43635.1 bifunctional [glutamate--ammonia ligase]-adenylyl-L-tyrosine phosphorylase/[glutamate--ammonia-ligase] adenylyltransferase [Candidatus Methylospira mobilis]WNV04624.1 bifunctional [glutamate--ammonia ligase]-adenylyl-L-tyrosine phosphorylase/[glutamate--ammonia-ligase] adenylyltransferase [Candidatus Methylospira mobilis]
MSRNRQELPEVLQRQVSESCEQLLSYFSAHQSGLAAEQVDALLRVMPSVFASSLFARNQCKLYPDVFVELAVSGCLFDTLDVGKLALSLKCFFSQAGDDDALMSGLRRVRNREMLRIAWRDIAGWDDIDNTLRELSILAQTIIAETLEHLFQQACDASSVPLTPEGLPQRLVTLAMGKLGAYELNFSSDVDLIFAYEYDGELFDRYQTSYGEFYTRLIRRLIRVLDETTADGFVFRVDVRLRPFGQSGPLVMNFAAMETYYATQAGEWERYAMIKARVITGDWPSAQHLQSMLHAFTYRRYLDYRALEELRSLKQKIGSQLQRKDTPENIKLGNGGIRECEFIAQAFQLIRGGQEPGLRERSIILVLKNLAELGYLPQSVSADLITHYRFLRTVENRIQEYADQHMHTLPVSEIQQLAMAYALGFSGWAKCKAHIDEVRKEVRHHFEQTFTLPVTGTDHTQMEAQSPWLEMDNDALQQALIRLGYAEYSTIQALLSAFFHGAAVKKLTRRGRDALNRLLPLLLSMAGKQIPDCRNQVIERLLHLLEVIATRNVYYTLLIENPGALERLVELAASSAWIISYIAEQPLLLDELLDNRQLYKPLSRRQLSDDLVMHLARVDTDDTEALLTALRQFKQSNVLKIAASDIAGIIPLMVVSDYLTWLAEVLVDAVLAQAWRVTALKHDIGEEAREPGVQGFAVIAYGKMGGLEMSYSSDLDLVYLYEDTLPPVTETPSMFYAKLAQRMLGMLSAQMLSGRLYEVDLRLRPSGNSGLLVSSMSAYEHYQMNNAWVWELQALVRARWVAGDRRLEAGFNAIRAGALARASSLDGLRLSVVEMREKMRGRLLTDVATRFDLKQGRGGVVDIEFIVQFGVLKHAAQYPALLQYTDVMRLLDALGETGYLDEESRELLKQSYRLFRERIHSAALLHVNAGIPVTEDIETRNGVLAIWRQIMESD